MNAADYLLECADPRTSALVSESHQFSYAELRDAAARVAGEFLLLFCPRDKPESVPDALHGLQAALRAGIRRLEGQFQLQVIGKPTARRGSAWRT